MHNYQKLKINLKNIRIGRCVETTAEIDDTDETPQVGKSYFIPCTALKKRQIKVSVRKIYIECEENFDEKVKEDLHKLKIGEADTLDVFCKAATQEYLKDKMGTDIIIIDKYYYNNIIITLYL